MYKLFKDKTTGWEAVIKTDDGSCIPKSQENSDYQAYLKFLEEGGQPLPAEENQ